MRFFQRALSMPANAILAAAVLVSLYLTSLYSYVLFHSMAELFSIAIAGAIYVLSWNFRRFYRDSFLPFIGTAYLFCSVIDLLHALAYKGMGVFPGYDANLPTQLWIAARYLQGASLLAAPLFIHRKINIHWLLAGFSSITALLLLSIFAWNIFPVCYIEGSGLTSFKIYSEYLMDFLFALAIFFLLQKRKTIDQTILKWMVGSIALTMVSELAFTYYVDVYGISNLVGHFGKIAAYYLLYKATIETETGAIFADMTQLRAAENALLIKEAQAQRSLAELQSIYAHTPVGLCFFDAQLHYQAINELLAEINGKPVSEHIGKSVFDILSEPMVQSIEQSLQRTIATKQPVLNQEIHGKANSHSQHEGYWLVSYHPVFENNKEFMGVSCVVQDVTEQRLAEAALRSSEQNLKLFIEYTPTAIAMFDQEMRYMAASRRYLSDYRLQQEDIIGCSHYDIFPETTDHWKEIHRRCLAGAVEKCDEEPLHRADGSTDWVRWEIRPWYNIAGETSGIILYSEVITERKQIQAALQEREKQLHTLGDHLPEGVIYRYVQDPDGMPNFEFISAGIEGITGVTANEALQDSKALLSTIFSEDYERLVAEEVRSRTLLTPFELEIRQLHKITGEIHWSLLRSMPTRRPNGSTFWDGIQLDITERKRMTDELAAANTALLDYADQLKRSNHELEQFAFIASHDLQEPLRIVKMFGNMLELQMKEVVSEETAHDAFDSLRRMKTATVRMQSMIDGLLELSRINTQGANFATTDLTPLVNEVVSDLEPRLRASGGQVVVGQLPCVEVDELLAHRLFQNLIGNALKFHKPGVPPVVEVSSIVSPSLSNQSILLSIKDNGIGFEEQHAERIFRPFQRLNGKNEYEGNGLGLSICQKIVERHHGSIAAHSRPGEGAEFLITFPIHQPIRV